MTSKTLAGAAVAVTGAAFLYRKLLRQPILTWGATDEEAAARLPGDEQDQVGFPTGFPRLLEA